MKRAIAASAILGVGALSIAIGATQVPAAGQPSRGGAPPPKVVELEKVKDTLYLLKGGGGNTAVFITDIGVVLVDTKLAGWGQPLMDKIKTITPKPVTTIINTHTHGDHNGSNRVLRHGGRNRRPRKHPREHGQDGGVQGEQGELPPEADVQGQDVARRRQGQDRAVLFRRGHTNGDAWVVFPALRVMHAGDMFAGKQVPTIDGNNGGSGLAYPDTLANAARSVKNIDAIITGHSTMMTMADLDEYARFNRDFRELVIDGFNHGLSVSEVIGRWKLPVQYKGYAAPNPDRVKTNVEQMFGELAD